VYGAGIAQWYSAGLRAGYSGFESRQRLRIFLFTTASRPALGPTQTPIQRVCGSFSLGIIRPGCEADHSPPSSAEVKNAWSYTSTPPMRLMTWCSVKKRYFTLMEYILERKYSHLFLSVQRCFRQVIFIENTCHLMDVITIQLSIQ
jgi:hypothetical protein